MEFKSRQLSSVTEKNRGESRVLDTKSVEKNLRKHVSQIEGCEILRDLFTLEDLQVLNENLILNAQNILSDFESRLELQKHVPDIEQVLTPDALASFKLIATRLLKFRSNALQKEITSESEKESPDYQTLEILQQNAHILERTISHFREIPESIKDIRRNPGILQPIAELLDVKNFNLPNNPLKIGQTISRTDMENLSLERSDIIQLQEIAELLPPISKGISAQQNTWIHIGQFLASLKMPARYMSVFNSLYDKALPQISDVRTGNQIVNRYSETLPLRQDQIRFNKDILNTTYFIRLLESFGPQSPEQQNEFLEQGIQELQQIIERAMAFHDNLRSHSTMNSALETKMSDLREDILQDELEMQEAHMLRLQKDNITPEIAFGDLLITKYTDPDRYYKTTIKQYTSPEALRAHGFTDELSNRLLSNLDISTEYPYKGQILPYIVIFHKTTDPAIKTQVVKILRNYFGDKNFGGLGTNISRGLAPEYFEPSAYSGFALVGQSFVPTSINPYSYRAPADHASMREFEVVQEEVITNLLNSLPESRITKIESLFRKEGELKEQEPPRFLSTEDIQLQGKSLITQLRAANAELITIGKELPVIISTRGINQNALNNVLRKRISAVIGIFSPVNEDTGTQSSTETQIRSLIAAKDRLITQLRDKMRTEETYASLYELLLQAQSVEVELGECARELSYIQNDPNLRDFLRASGLDRQMDASIKILTSLEYDLERITTYLDARKESYIPSYNLTRKDVRSYSEPDSNSDKKERIPESYSIREQLNTIEDIRQEANVFKRVAELNNINPENDEFIDMRIQIPAVQKKYAENQELTDKEKYGIILKARSILRNRVQGEIIGLPLKESFMHDKGRLGDIRKRMNSLYDSTDPESIKKVAAIEELLNSKWESLWIDSILVKHNNPIDVMMDIINRTLDSTPIQTENPTVVQPQQTPEPKEVSTVKSTPTPLTQQKPVGLLGKFKKWFWGK